MNAPPFILWSPDHLIALVVVLAVSVLVPLAVRRWGSASLARRFAIGFAVVSVVFEVSRLTYRVVGYGLPVANNLPLQLCGISVFLGAIVLVWRQQVCYELIYFWGLGGTLQAMLTPDIDQGWPHRVFIGYFISHGIVLFAALYATIVFGLRPYPRSIPRVFGLTVVYAFGIVTPLNLLLGQNYLYLRRSPGGATLIDYLGPWPWYIVSLAGVALLSFVVYYAPFWVYDRFRSRSADIEASQQGLPPSLS